MTRLRIRASVKDLVDRFAQVGWWLHSLRWCIGAAITLAVGAGLGQWVDDKNWSFLADPAIEPWCQYTIAAAVGWLILSATKQSWHPDAVVSSKDEQMLLTQLALSARSIADVKGKPMNTRRQFVRGELAIHMVNALSRVYSKVADVRTIIYEMSADQDEMWPVQHAGERRPSGKFTLQDQRGQDAIQFVLTDKGAKLEEDIKRNTGGNWSGRGDGYRTYIAAPVVSSSGFHGMITIDAPNPGDLTQHDKRVIDLAANILSVGFAHIKK
jgi:hypothetical protein